MRRGASSLRGARRRWRMLRSHGYERRKAARRVACRCRSRSVACRPSSRTRARRHVTSNLTKIIVLVSPLAASGQTQHSIDLDIASLCVKVEEEFKRAVSSPFYTMGSVCRLPPQFVCLARFPSWFRRRRPVPAPVRGAAADPGLAVWRVSESHLATTAASCTHFSSAAATNCACWCHFGLSKETKSVCASCVQALESERFESRLRAIAQPFLRPAAMAHSGLASSAVP